MHSGEPKDHEVCAQDDRPLDFVVLAAKTRLQRCNWQRTSTPL